MKKLLLITSSLLIPMIAHAVESSCTVAPSCEDLGYRQTTTICNTLGLKYVNCPFDKGKVACVSQLPGLTSSGSITIADACKAAGYPYIPAQCGKMGTRQIGIPCPYSSNYYYCDYPNKNARLGWYLCADGTASPTPTECGGRTYVVGVVIKTPTSGRKGVVALTKYGFFGHGDIFQDFCKNSYATDGPRYAGSIISTPRPPNTTTEPSLIKKYFSKIKTEISYNYSSYLTYPLWAAECWDTGEEFRCHAITSSGTLSDSEVVSNDRYGICVADF